MSKYIDADALSEYVEKQYMGFIGNPTWDDINSAPSIDIVRCGECKHWCKGDEVYGICYRCPNTRQMKADDFCSYGSRSEKPNNCDTCKYGEDKHRYAHICNECGVGINNYEPKDEPQTERSE